VAVEKLFCPKIAKNKIASGCVISDLLEFQDISGHPNFDHFRRNASFSTPTGVIATMRFFLRLEIGVEPFFPEPHPTPSVV
jgi:hypothetical protein